MRSTHRNSKVDVNVEDEEEEVVRLKHHTFGMKEMSNRSSKE